MRSNKRPSVQIGYLAKYILRFSRFNARNFIDSCSELCTKTAAETKSFFKKCDRRRTRRNSKKELKIAYE